MAVQNDSKLGATLLSLTLQDSPGIVQPERYIMTTQEEVTKQLINQDKDMLDLVRQLFNLVKQQREYNLLQDQQIEGLTNRIRKLEKR